MRYINLHLHYITLHYTDCCCWWLDNDCRCCCIATSCWFLSVCPCNMLPRCSLPRLCPCLPRRLTTCLTTFTDALSNPASSTAPFHIPKFVPSANANMLMAGAREPWRRWSLCSPNFIRAHPTFGITIFFPNKSTDNSTSVQHLYCCLLICLHFFTV